MEQTFMMIKPDAIARNLIGPILSMVEKAGLRIVRLRMVQLEVEEAQAFYQVHAERPFYSSLVSSMTSGPIAALVVEGESAVARLTDIVGATDPAKAAEGTIRNTYALDIERNSVHRSDALETARQEIAFFGLGLGLRS